ncbi:MAG: RnfABCDGE type electron transport complex subunit D [Aphanocapsa lilacina HA4352-LM1]|jgi:hypothetical protein|nr:RnfABCDGE type electron transport complex subunit D [Aphanocapsa lilacina HA4352-LM1]
MSGNLLLGSQTAAASPSKSAPSDPRLVGLRRFALTGTILTLLGHTILGFEVSWAYPLVSLGTAYAVEAIIEVVDAWARRRPVRFLNGSWQDKLDFFLPAHITAVSIALLIYANENLWPVAFAAAVAVASKTIFRAPFGKKTRHFLNPSNFGITVTILVFPWITTTPPYQFTENAMGAIDWLLPLVLLCLGGMLNAKNTLRIPLIGAWLAGFALQGIVRSLIADTPMTAALFPMTGTVFVLYTLYMCSDPGTTPSDPKGQVLFGFSLAATYGLLMSLHVPFGFFFALTLVCIVRGLGLYVQSWNERTERPGAPKAAVPASAG